MDRTSIAAAVLAASLCAGCESDTKLAPVQVPVSQEPITAPLTPIVSDLFEVKGNLQGNQVTFWLETDLPDDVVVSGRVSRDFVVRNSEGTDESFIPYWDEDTTVGALRSPRKVTFDDHHFANEVAKRLKLLTMADETSIIESINQSVVVDLHVFPVHQPAALLGKGNNNLTGAVVYNHVGNNNIEGNLAFPSKLSVAVKARSDWIDPERLQVGHRYEVSQRTSVMPEFSSMNQLVDLAQMVIVPAGTLIEIRRVERSKDAHRYLVRAEGDSSATAGWVNVNALLGQTLAEVK